jgi:hypothetical protein
VPCGRYCISHPACYPIYELLEEQGRPLLFHVGGGGHLVLPAYAENGLEPERLYHEKESAIPSLTYIGIPAPVEMALAALIIDGVFERFPRLRCGVIEQGAAWVPGFLRRLDAALDHFGRPRQRARLSLRPSEYFLRQVRVTPFPFEEIPWLIKETGAGIYLFGTDYPHDEGGEAPLELFDLALDPFPASVQEAIYWRNFEDLMGDAIPPSLRVRPPGPRTAGDLRMDDREVLRRTGEPLAVHRKKVLLRLLAADTAARLGISWSDRELREAIDSFRIDCGLFDLNETRAWMQREGVTEESLCRVIRDGVLADKLSRYLQDRMENELPDQIRISTGRRWMLDRSARPGEERSPASPQSTGHSPTSNRD